MAENTGKTQSELSGVKALLGFRQDRLAKTLQHASEVRDKIENLTQSLLDIKSRKIIDMENARKLEEQRQAEELAQIAEKEKEKQPQKVEEEVIAVPKIIEEAPIVEEKPVEFVTPKIEAEPEAPAVVEQPVVRENVQTRIFDNSTSNPQKRPQNSQYRPQQNGQSRPAQNGQSRPPYQNNGQQRPQQNGQYRPQNGQNFQGGQNRPNGANAPRQGGSISPRQGGNAPRFSAATPPPIATKPGYQQKTVQKKTPAQQAIEDKKAQNKRALIRKGYIVNDQVVYDEEGNETARHFKHRSSKKNEFILPTSTKIESAVITSEFVTIKTLSEKIGKTGGEILKQLMVLGILKTINDVIDFDSADLVATELGVTLSYEPEKTAEDKLFDIETETDSDDGDNLVTRPPVVTIMGHVDHGKTSLLDYIRKANVTAGEAGGITQHIGAYTVSLNNKPITFLDTPGHEAFTSMRMRGAQVTDIAIIVVAADDGIMPQTIEAINHAKLAGVSIIIAVNKIDKTGAQPERVLQQLTEHELVPEEWGGDTPVVYVSAKTGENINKLLETVLLVAEMLELKANPDRYARGTIIEARLDKGKGPLATVLVQNGTLKISDFVVAGICVGKIRAMIDDKGKNIKSAGPSIPVSVIGFSEVPNAGDPISVVGDEKLAKQVANERQLKIRSEINATKASTSLDDIFAKIKQGESKSLNIIIKADVQGSVEAVKQSLVKLTNDEVTIAVIHGAVGAINDSDVMLANTANAIIIGFNVRADAKAKITAERDGIDIRLYRVIYDAIDDVSAAIKGMLAPKFKEVTLGNAEVRQVYKITGVGTVAGCYVTDGKITRNAKVRLYRDNNFVFEGELDSLKRFKDDAKEVAKGYECGMSIVNFNDIKEGDVIEAFVMEQINE